MVVAAPAEEGISAELVLSSLVVESMVVEVVDIQELAAHTEAVEDKKAAVLHRQNHPLQKCDRQEALHLQASARYRGHTRRPFYRYWRKGRIAMILERRFRYRLPSVR